MSSDGRIDTPMASPYIGCQRRGLAVAYGLKQNVSQPHRITPLNTERLAKHPSLVAPARVHRAQTIVLDLADIEDGSIAVR